jgi:hypothetical protein
MDSIADRKPTRQAPSVRVVALAAAAACAVLALAWMAAPQGLLVGRRAGALFLGFAVAFYGVRNAPAASAHAAVFRGGAVACAALAVLGVIEYGTAHAGPGIAVAAAGEALIAFGLARAARRAG